MSNSDGDGPKPAQTKWWWDAPPERAEVISWNVLALGVVALVIAFVAKWWLVVALLGVFCVAWLVFGLWVVEQIRSWLTRSGET
jgi:hypothetical protein